jgi:hypothetical protein
MYNLAVSESLKRSLSLPRIFVTSVAGTYVVAAIIWILTGQPSTGTSIIGFTMVVAIAASSGADFLAQLRRIYEGNHRAVNYLKSYGLLIVCGVASLIALRSYLLANSSYQLHLAGGAVSGVVMLGWALKKDKRAPKPAQTRKSVGSS